MDKYKLIAIDMDDTLLNNRLEITERSLQAVRRVREKGIHVTLSTGRMFCSAYPYAMQLGIDLPLITYQGALVKNALSGEVLAHKTIPLELARQVVADVQKCGYHINVYTDDKLYVEKVTPVGLDYARICGVDLNPVGDLVAFLQQPPTKIVVISTESQIDDLKGIMEPIYRDRLHVCKSKPTFLEFSHPKATKGYALAKLAELFNVQQHEVMAIGDSDNDVEMLEYAGMAVVMANARDHIKTLADYITDSNEEDGVAKVLEKLVLAD
ncbi:Cof-type HAD-IIB family hydrolase [Peptococcaceae bacterium 1198_IL3148]